MNRRTLSTALLVAAAILTASCSGKPRVVKVLSVNWTQGEVPPATIVISTTATMAATVTNDPANAGVTWSCTPGNSLATCGSFNQTATGSGVTTTYTAPPNPGSVVITATSVTDPDKFISVNVTVTGVPVTTENFVFYATGQEAAGPNFYSLAGVVTIVTSGDSAGTVVGGEQDYNDAVGITSTDEISGGNLSIDASTGQGTITLVTGNASFGGFVTPAGEEQLAVQFVNANHALITQWDGTATSSGSMDLQTSTSTPSGNFAFTLSGVDNISYCPVVFGGVFSITGGSFSGGTFDVDDCGETAQGNPFPGSVTVTAPDALGRGTFTDTGLATTIAYYVVGTEAVRIIDIDDADSALGSAYGQGAGAFSNSSLGTFVFADFTNPWNAFYQAAGILTANSEAGTVQGVGDDDEAGFVISNASIVSGDTSYSIGANGYGSLTIDGDLGDVTLLGIYMTDPNLNLNDPNNRTSGTGGALIADLNLIGTGVIVPQTDTTTASFAGNYAFGVQGFASANFAEFDSVGQGSVSSGVFNGTGYISDPFALFDGTNKLFQGATFSGTATPDGSNPGRYTMTPFVITPPGDEPTDFTTVVYQASGTQLFTMDEDDFSYWLGPVEQQGETVTPLPSAKVRALAKPAQKK